jgi:hypothetical protein
VLRLCLGSFGVMAPWPLVGILLAHSHFNQWDEAGLLFGGITGIPIAILTLVGLPAAMLTPLIVLVWIAVMLVPNLFLARRLSSRPAVLTLFGVQGFFSLVQAAAGALMIAGKAV